MAKSDFARTIENWVSGVYKKRKQLVTEVRAQIGENIIDKTPVDRGRAKGGWRGTANKSTDEVSVSLDKSGEHTKAELRRMAHEVRTNQKFFITNKVPYLPYLEDGSSTQAPQGMVALTISEFHQAVRDALKELDQ